MDAIVQVLIDRKQKVNVCIICSFVVVSAVIRILLVQWLTDDNNSHLINKKMHAIKPWTSVISRSPFEIFLFK